MFYGRCARGVKMNPKLSTWITQSLLDLFTSSDNQIIDRNLKEECINHRFALYLEKNKPPVYYNYYIDVEYDKNGSEMKTRLENGVPKIIRPDILVHKRTDDINDNLLAIECKKGYLNSNDKTKLNWLLGNGYNYQACIGFSYQPSKDYFMVYEMDKQFNKPRRISKKICVL